MNFEKVGEADKGGSGFDGTLLAKSDALRLDFEVLLLVQRNHDPNGDIAKGFAEVDAELGIEHDVKDMNSTRETSTAPNSKQKQASTLFR